MWWSVIFLLIYRVTIIYLEADLARRLVEVKCFDYRKNFWFLKLLAGNSTLKK